MAVADIRCRGLDVIQTPEVALRSVSVFFGIFWSARSLLPSATAQRLNVHSRA